MISFRGRDSLDREEPCVGAIMGPATEGGPCNSTDLNLFGDTNGEDVPLSGLSGQNLDGMNHRYDFGSVLSSQDLSIGSLSNTLLNKGIEGLCTPSDMTQAEFSPEDQDGLGIVVPMTNHGDQNQYQHQHTAIASLSAQQAIFSPSPSNAYLNTTPGSFAPRPSRQFTTRPSSLLRNEYLPETPSGASSSMMASHAYPHHITSSPSRYVSRGPSASQNLQGFQESNMRSSLDQSRYYNTGHQVGYEPTYTLGQHQLQSAYIDPRQYTHHPSGQISYGLPPQQDPQAEARHNRQLKDMQPSTPPNSITPSRKDNSTPRVIASSPGNVVIKREHEVSLPGSPLAKKEPRKVPRRKIVRQRDRGDEDGVLLTKSDALYVEGLINAMNDSTEAEDNPGMQATWNKIRENKPGKVRQKCTELLALIKRAQREQLVDKKPANLYPNFDHRFEETCAALRTQKTVCKHLMEAPYSHTVANDPTYAAQRVRNNRRVNGQKRQAITMGRQALGLQGQGKGKSMKKVDPVPFEELYEGEDSDDGLDAEEDDGTDSPVPVVKMQSSSRKKTKVTRRTHPDDDYEDSADQSPAPKKAKRENRSTYKVIGDEQYVDNIRSSGKSYSRSNGLPPDMSSSPIQVSEPMRSQRGVQPLEYFNPRPVYGPTAQSMLPEYYDGHQQQSSHFDQAYHPIGYSSGTDPDHSDQPNGSNDAVASKLKQFIDLS